MADNAQISITCERCGKTFSVKPSAGARNGCCWAGARPRWQRAYLARSWRRGQAQGAARAGR